MQKISLLPPFLLTTSGVLLFYIEAAVTVPPVEILRLLLFLCILLVLLAIPIHSLLRDWSWTGISLAILASTLFFPPGSFKILAVYMACMFLLWCCLLLPYKWLRQIKFLNTFFIFASSLFLLLPVIALGRAFLPFARFAPAASRLDKPEIALSESVYKPDVYFIVLDGYGRADILKDYYAFDNSQFINYLHSKGFVTPEHAQSNYSKTVLSVVSTLNLDYVQHFAPGLEESPFWWQMIPFIEHSRLRAALENAGYETYAMAVDWDITDNRTVDRYYQPFRVPLTDLEGYFLNVTPIGRLQQLISPYASTRTYQAHRTFIDGNFASLSEISTMRGRPKFVFGHILATHPPFVFDTNGNPLTPTGTFRFVDASDYGGNRKEYRDLYIAQVNLLNARLETAIDTILENSTIPPIIILQADHGPSTPSETDFASNRCIREGFSIFAAYLLPGLDATAVPSDITAVNTFRLVLNQSFHANLPILENASYFPRDPIRIYGLEDVSSRLDKSCAAQGLP